MSSSINIKSICGSVAVPVRIKDIDWNNYRGESVFCCGNCHTILESRESWYSVYGDPYKTDN